MPTALFSFKRLANGHIMFHGFTAPSQGSAETDLQGHAQGCPDFGSAYRADQTIEFAREVDSLPEFNGDAIEEWLDELLGEEADEDEPIDMVPE